MRARSPALIATALLALGGCSSDDAAAPVSAPNAETVTASPEWSAVAESPLSPREGTLMLWTGAEVLVIGGSDAPPCPPTADCITPEIPALSDAAAFDPETGEWRELADAPKAIFAAEGAVLGDVAYVFAPRIFGRPGSADPVLLTYDILGDKWGEASMPPDDPGQSLAQLVSADDRLFAILGSDEYGTSPDYEYLPEEKTWHELPDDPLPLSFDRIGIWTGDELVLFGKRHVPNPGSTEPSVALAASYDPVSRTWTRLPDSEILNALSWLPYDGKLVNPTIGTSDAGGDWDRAYPQGGVLDLATGEWSELPELPPGTEDLGFHYDGNGFSDSSAIYSHPEGLVLDVVAGEWIELPPLPAEISNQSLVAAGRDLFVFGGVDFFAGNSAELVADAWLWRAPLH